MMNSNLIFIIVSGAFQPRLSKEILKNGYSNVKHTGDTTR